MIYSAKTTLQSKKFNELGKAKVKFDLTVFTNQHGVIYNWEINLIEMHFQTGSQPTYITTKNKIWKIRNEVCKILKVNQVVRSKNSRLIKLNDEQLSKVNKLFNVKDKGTLKNIDAVTRGNNWSGSFSKPDSSNLLSNDFAPGSILLIDQLVALDDRSIEILKMQAKEISFSEIFELSKELQSLYSFINMEKDACDLPHFRAVMKEYKAKYVKTAKDVENMISRERSKYGSNVDKHYSTLPFGFKSKKQFQKAHILDVYRIKDMIIKLKSNSQEWKGLLKKVSDPENFIPLPESHHREFDKDNFTYTVDGMIYPVTQEGLDYINEFIEEKYKKIPQKFITEKKMEYIKERNGYIM